MDSDTNIQKGINFLEKGINFTSDNVVAYTIDGNVVNDAWKSIVVIFNANNEKIQVTIPKKDWVIVVNRESAGIKNLGEINVDKVIVPKNTSYVLVDKKSFENK